MKELLLTSNKIKELIPTIYDAALEPSQWNTVLKMLATTLKAEQANMRIIDTQLYNVSHSYCHNKDPNWNKIYSDYYIKKDPWLNEILKGKDTHIACTHHFISNKEYEKLEFHSDFVSPQKIHYGMGGKIHINENMTGFLTLSRDRNKQGFEDIYYKNLMLLIPHIQKSLFINQKTYSVDFQNNLLSEAINQINNPLLIVNKNGQILFINTLAEQILNQHVGIKIKNNHLMLDLQDEHNKLNYIISQATNSDDTLRQGGALLYTHPSASLPLSILINPINPKSINNTQFDDNNALVVLTRLNTQPLSATQLSDLYNFSQAEAKLVVELSQGLTLDKIANKFSVSKNTLRSQLRSCFHKTGVNRQAELIRLINDGPAGVLKTTL